ncbi:hypothetical protein E8D34_10890 [Nocardioides sp. GY 10113]|uniref:hypothetical protein n=1 Tax=Nocardioides sp. GY 10113 TaxID=2569761 RepID=UPI0010A7C19C|nr:hypothetical protein [Nocardioides sp. GY 10113]TIC86744.1 hypothetical protein E8D34_10890 [Nocardioides sp. GY 10113]
MTGLDARPRDAPARRPATLLCAGAAIVVGALLVLYGAMLVHWTNEDPSGDPLVGIGYLLAGVAGIPGAVGLLLAAGGAALSRRTAGLVLAVLALATVLVPILLVAWLLIINV